MTDTTNETTPVDGLRDAHEIAPEPEWDWDTDAPVETFLRAHLVRAAAWLRALDQVPLDSTQWAMAVHLGTLESHIALLLLGMAHGEDPTRTARYAHNALCSGDVAQETIWEQLRKRGIPWTSIRPFVPANRDLDTLTRRLQALLEDVTVQANPSAESDLRARLDAWIADPVAEARRENQEALAAAKAAEAVAAEAYRDDLDDEDAVAEAGL